MVRRRVFLTLCLMTGGPVLAAATGADGRAGGTAVRVRFEAVVEVDTGVVRLGDLGQVEGGAASDLSEMELGVAPQPGLARQFRAAQLARTLNGRLGRPVSWSGAEVVTVRRRAHPLDRERLETAVRSWLAAYWQVASEAVEVRSLQWPANLALPPGEQHVRFTGQWADGGVECEIRAGDVTRRVRLLVEAAVTAEVAVACRAVPFGQVVTEADVRFEPRRLSSCPWKYVRRPEQLLHAKLRRPLAEGQPLELAALRAERVVKRGSPVTITYRRNGVSLAAPGRALGSAHLGEVVEVRNDRSGQVVRGRVLGPDTVLVGQGGGS